MQRTNNFSINILSHFKNIGSFSLSNLVSPIALQSWFILNLSCVKAERHWRLATVHGKITFWSQSLKFACMNSQFKFGIPIFCFIYLRMHIYICKDAQLYKTKAFSNGYNYDVEHFQFRYRTPYRQMLWAVFWRSNRVFLENIRIPINIIWMCVWAKCIW